MNEKVARKPDFKSDGVAVWVNLDKNGNKYLSITVIGHNKLFAFENKDKKTQLPSENTITTPELTIDYS